MRDDCHVKKEIFCKEKNEKNEKTEVETMTRKLNNGIIDIELTAMLKNMLGMSNQDKNDAVGTDNSKDMGMTGMEDLPFFPCNQPRKRYNLSNEGRTTRKRDKNKGQHHREHHKKKFQEK